MRSARSRRVIMLIHRLFPFFVTLVRTGNLGDVIDDVDVVIDGLMSVAGLMICRALGG